jgi:hypothetical protein
MGTLHDQPMRTRRDGQVELADALSALRKLDKPFTTSDIVALFAALVEQSKVAAYLDNADILDEQLAGFGEILQSISDNLKGEDDEIL